MTDFQERFGKKIIQYFRRNAQFESLQRGHDVTFPEFIKYVLNAESIEHGHVDRHWTSYTNLCHPCSIDYDFIGKYELFGQDMQEVMSVTGLDKIVSFPKSTHRKGQPQTKSALKQYTSTISEQDTKDVCEKFKMDFLLFNYTCQSH